MKPEVKYKIPREGVPIGSRHLDVRVGGGSTASGVTTEARRVPAGPLRAAHQGDLPNSFPCGPFSRLCIVRRLPLGSALREGRAGPAHTGAR